MKEDYIEDIKEIKAIMSRSTRFISLSGMSGVAAGIVALLGVFLAYQGIFKGKDYLTDAAVPLREGDGSRLLLIALATLLLALGGAVYFTTRKTRKAGHKAWGPQTQRLLINLFIPLLTGGLLCLMFLGKGFVGFLAPLSLIFYGLGLVNASKYTLSEIRSLGLIELALGLIAMALPAYGLFLWGLGFGVLHIVYGIIIQWRYPS